MENGVRLSLIVCRLCLKYAGFEGLRIAIDQRKPGALNLDRDAMALFENVRRIMHIDRVIQYLAMREGLRVVKTRSETASEYLVRNNSLAAAQVGRCSVIVWIDVNEFDDPIGVTSGRTRKQLCRNVSDNRYICVQWLCLPRQHIRALGK